MKPQGDQAYASVHKAEAYELEADGYVHLYRITMSPPGEPVVVIRLTPQKTVTWQGVTWESHPINLADYQQNTSGEMSRPKLSVVNPQGFYSRYVHAGWLDNAEAVRMRVLKPHLDANINSYLKDTWRVGRIAVASKTVVVMELRSALDGAHFVLPARAFYPPEFTTVSLS